MDAKSADRNRRGFRLPSLTGPVFAKELRVSARRRRSFALRLGYLLLLTVFVGLVWLGSFRTAVAGGSLAARASRMSEAGKLIIVTIVWFQFCTTQVIAVVLLSTAIGGELSRRTLGVLMSTPIRSFQIVMGKLLSGLWQLLVLIASSLPLLLLVRVFGGVPWDFVLSGLAITLASMLFVASVSLLFSIGSGRAHVAMLRTVIVVGLLYGLLPWGAWGLIGQMRLLPAADVTSAVMQVNPPGALAAATGRVIAPGWAGALSVSWPLHCAMVLGASAAVLAVCVVRVRRAALRQASGEAGRPGRRRRAAGGRGRVRRVVGPPVLWRELRAPMFPSRLRGLIVVAVMALILGATYAAGARHKVLADPDTHVTYVLIFTSLGVLGTAVMSATGIAVEREARCWPLLMATALSDTQVLLGKAAGALRRALPFWGLLAGHLALFTLTGFLHPLAWLHLGLLVGAVMALLTGTGLYFSARLGRPAAAAVANVALAIAVWVVLPVLGFLSVAVSGGDRETANALISANPVAQAVVVVEPAVGAKAAHAGELRYHWLWGSAGAGRTTWLMLASLGGHGLVGLMFAWRAERWFRKRMF